MQHLLALLAASQSRQSGVAEAPCPVSNQLNLPPSTHVQAQLRWWLEGVEQEPVIAEVSL